MLRLLLLTTCLTTCTLTITSLSLAQKNSRAKSHQSRINRDCTDQITDAERRWGRLNCKGFGEYAFQISYAHTTSEFTSRFVLTKGTKELSLTLPLKGVWSWPRVIRRHPVEWRYRGKRSKPRIHAVIYKIFYYLTEDEYEQTRWVVVRIHGDKACSIGVRSKLLSARKLADSSSNCRT